MKKVAESCGRRLTSEHAQLISVICGCTARLKLLVSRQVDSRADAPVPSSGPARRPPAFLSPLTL